MITMVPSGACNGLAMVRSAVLMGAVRVFVSKELLWVGIQLVWRLVCSVGGQKSCQVVAS
jgi:hypothetical protein